MQSSTAEMVEKKVLEMAQHASFHQHVSYNLSTILHAFTAGKTDPVEIAGAFSRARGLEVITRVVSGEPTARPTVISLCCGVSRRVIDKFGSGVAEEQARRLTEAVVSRLELGVSGIFMTHRYITQTAEALRLDTGDDAQTVECQVECARLFSSIAGRASSVLLAGGALGAVEGMLERLGASNRPGNVGRRHRKQAAGHVRMPSFPCPSVGRGYSTSWFWGGKRSIMRPCCEALERVSRTEEGRAAFEERGTGGVLLATIRDFPDALDEGSDAALAAALAVIERIFRDKSPMACATSLRARTEEESSGDPHLPTSSDYANCVEILLAVAEATPDAPGSAAASCLWWLSSASQVAPDRALVALLDEAVSMERARELKGDTGEVGRGSSQALPRPSSEVWSWFPASHADEERVEAKPAALEAGRFISALCLCKPGSACVEGAFKREAPRAAQAIVDLCASEEPDLAAACLRIVERLTRTGLGERVFVQAGALDRAVEAGARFEAPKESESVLDAEAKAIAAALGVVASLARAGGEGAHPVVDRAFELSVRCLERVAEFSGRAAAAAAKSALDVITIRLTRKDRLKAGVNPAAVDDDGASHGDHDGTGRILRASAAGERDQPMEVLRDAGGILAAMRAHPMDARVQQSGWKSLIAMDTGRGDVGSLLSSGGDSSRSRRQMLKDCLKRHGGDSLVAGQVADILEGLVLSGDSDTDNSLTSSMSDGHGDQSPRWGSGAIHTHGVEPFGSPGDDFEGTGQEPHDPDAPVSTVGKDVPEEAHPLEVGPAHGGPEVTGSEDAYPKDAAAADVVHGGLLSPENVLVELSRDGQMALARSEASSDSCLPERDASVADPKIARALFGVEADDRSKCNGDRAGDGSPNEADDLADAPSVTSMAEVKLDRSWTELERLHGDVVGRSRIIGGESAEMAAAMLDPSALRREVGAMLDDASGDEAKAAIAASSLAMVGALTAATDALASSQKEVQRYLQMSRDLRGTSTWKDIAEAMQWTMDTLKATVILFAPHTDHLITRDLSLCKSEESAAKLFKEAALQIKIVVVELAGEHPSNTEWKLAPERFERLPDNRKIMMLRHLRSLVVAFDYLSDASRKELTTALEIIKNRETLNMMGKSCVQAEALEERRRQARLASAEEKMRGRRPSGTRTANNKQGVRSASRAPSDGKGSPRGANGARSPGWASARPLASSPPGTPNAHAVQSPSASVRSRPQTTPKSARSCDSSNDGASANGRAGSRLRGIASNPRRRDASPLSSRSKSPVPRGGAAKSRTPRRATSTSPVPRRRTSRSPTPRSKVNPPPKIPRGT